MLSYWVVFLMTAFFAVTSSQRSARADGSYSTPLDARTMTIFIVLVLFIGLRDRVGGDWNAYLRYYERASEMTLPEVFAKTDPGYYLINFVSAQLGMGIAGTNTIAALVFTTGLLYFCNAQRNPLLAVCVAFPYLILIVGMGYSRQGIATGLVIIGFVVLGRGRFLWFVVWVLIAATFHRTAVILIPIAALTVTRNRFLVGLAVLCMATLGYQVLLQSSYDGLVENYISEQMQSSGAMIRLLMNAVPAIVFLLFRRQMVFEPTAYRLYRLFAIISLALLPALFATGLSTAIDRMALYIIPLQLAVLSQVPSLIEGKRSAGQFGSLLVVFYSALVLFVWLNFAVNASAWLPYRSFIWTGG